MITLRINLQGQMLDHHLRVKVNHLIIHSGSLIYKALIGLLMSTLTSIKQLVLPFLHLLNI
jgi:hypothetical protein